MKRVLLVIVAFILFIPSIIARNDFVIDTSKIEINSKGNSLIDNLDKSYKIDTRGFINTEVVNDKAKVYTKKIIDIVFNSKDNEDRTNRLHDEQFISDNNGFDTLSSLVFINMFVESINKIDIKYDYIKLIRTIEFSEGVITLSYFPNVVIDNNKEDFILILYLKENSNGYQLFYPTFTKGEDLEEFFYNLGNKEDSGEVIGDTYKSLSLDSNNDSNINTDELRSIYDNNVNSNVSISALEDADVNVYGSGFYIRKGIVVTSWSLLLEMLNNSGFIYVNDSNKNTMNIEGIVAADTDYDVVLLKLKDETGKAVKFSNNGLLTNDYVFTIDSKNNTGFMINYGRNITGYNGKYKNLLALNKSDIGSALYNKDGEVIGFNTSNSLNSDVSIANSTDYLIELQDILSNKDFNDIKSIAFEEFKDKYYYGSREEKIVNNIPRRVWNKYKKIGNIDKNISLKLVKANYVDEIVSLRYKNEASKSINTYYLCANYERELLKNNYVLIYNSEREKIYTNNKYRVIIKYYLDYLVVLMMEN